MSESNKQQISYDKEVQEVVVRTKKKRISGTFSAIGRLRTVHNNVDPDVFDKLTGVSKGAFKLFVELKLHRDDKTNLVPYPTAELDKTRKETFSRQLRELRQAGLVRVAQRNMKSATPGLVYQTKKQTYMIDPDALKCWNFADATILWEQCKK
jgi:hypothetical protein